MRAALIACALLLAGCGGTSRTLPAGDADNGKLLLRQFGCGSCHEIPGVADAQGRVGPPLKGVARRVYIAGVLPTSPDNMAAFIRTPRRFEPRTVMPEMGVTEAHARDMVAYLYSLE
jgi:cytochrome c